MAVEILRCGVVGIGAYGQFYSPRAACTLGSCSDKGAANAEAACLRSHKQVVQINRALACVGAPVGAQQCVALKRAISVGHKRLGHWLGPKQIAVQLRKAHRRSVTVMTRERVDHGAQMHDIWQVGGANEAGHGSWSFFWGDAPRTA